MTTFDYTTGNPANLTGGANASMTDIGGPFADLKTFLNGANIDATNLASGAVDVAELASALAAVLGVTQSGVVRRGKTIIATEEARTNAAYGKLTTPDQVSSVVLPTDGLLFIQYSALVKNSVASTGRAAIFIGTDQLVMPGNTTPVVVEQNFSGATDYDVLATTAASPYTGISTGAGDASRGSTPIAVGGGAIAVEAAAGTYDVSVQFKSASGTVTAKERRLRVWTMAFA